MTNRKILLLVIQVFMFCGNLFATDICISGIAISGNKQTKEFTILRELPFSVGDVMPEDKLIRQLAVATSHLNNTSLFNYVYLDYIPDMLDTADCLSCIVTVRVEERWYYWPQVSLKLEDRNLSTWIHDRNFDRITIGWGMRVYNVFGMRHKMTVSHYFGFEKGLRLGYYNIALDKERTKLLGFSGALLYNHTMDLKSENNKVIYLKNKDLYLNRSFVGNINYTYRPHIRSLHTFSLGYSRMHLGDTILRANSGYWESKNPINCAFNISYDFSYEHRDYYAYPTNGWFAGVYLNGITSNSARFFYGEMNLRLQYYKEFMPRLFWSSRLNTGLTFKNKHSYIYDRHVGYDDKNITGYDYYVVDGQHHAILNNDLRFCIMPKRVFVFGSNKDASKFKKIHFTLYLKLMYDMAYVYHGYPEPSNTLANTFLYGSGIGLDLVTYYDIVLNASYAVNKQRQGGFYFGIKAPIF
ncbi:MAG: hypothetical protein LBD53_00340 [Tannerella sp.]|nr:hypothetical protein [Tannerella sp.]